MSVKQQGSRGLPGYRAHDLVKVFRRIPGHGICVIASIKFDNPLNWIGPNLSSSQVTIGATQTRPPDR